MITSRRSFLRSLAAGAAAISPLGRLAAAKGSETMLVPKRKFGRHDLEVGVVGLGGQTLGLAESREEAVRIAHKAIERGIDFFDNAWDYHNGRAEEWMGEALRGGWRDRVFLMTKVCTHGKPLPDGGKEGAMRMLEDSLRRLRTDYLDLWMVHALANEEEVAKAYAAGGVLEAMDLARQQGKIRFTGFTGHSSPSAHLAMLRGGYPFDASLMPVSAIGTLSSRQFEKEVMAELAKRQVAVIGMKGFGGSRRAHLHGLVTIETVLRYSLGYPEVCTHLVGIDKMEFLDAAIAAAGPACTAPMTPAEQSEFTVALAQKGASRYAAYLQPGYLDGGKV